nr:hypothetical protein [Tanacetum cinerariifolium]
MVSYLTKSDASEGFNQIIDFLNGCYIKYALTVNPNIYVSCIKQSGILLPSSRIMTSLALSAKRTSWNEFSSAMASAVICLSIGKGFSWVETPLFKGMLVGQVIEEGGDAEEHVQDVTDGDAAQGDDIAAQRDDAQEPSIPSPIPPTPPPQPPQNLPSTYQVQHTPP